MDKDFCVLTLTPTALRELLETRWEGLSGTKIVGVSMHTEQSRGKIIDVYYDPHWRKTKND